MPPAMDRSRNACVRALVECLLRVDGDRTPVRAYSALPVPAISLPATAKAVRHGRMGAAGFFGLLLLGCGPLAAVFLFSIAPASFLVLLTLGR